MLNPSQEKAVKHFGKPLLIIAGAGSGKTKTLAHKLEYLVCEKGLRQDRVLVLTFTNKSAREIKERIIKVTGNNAEWTGTFHSIALRMLKQDRRTIGIIDEEDRKKLLKSILKDLSLGKEILELADAYILSRRENLEEPKDGILEEVYIRYDQMLKEQNLLDFSGILSEAYELLRRQSDRWRNFFEFVMVDEFQDTNRIQYEILKLLVKKNICVVGDPNQCIYEWRHARPDNILRFKSDFDPDIVKLEYNYRSKRHIIAVANAVLLASKAIWKDMIPTLKATKDGEEKPTVRRFQTQLEETVWIAQEIKRLLERYKPSDIAILVRVSYLTETFERAFFNARIPYRTVGAVRFFERAEVKDALAFLKLLTNPADELSFKRCLENALIGLGNKAYTFIKNFYEDNWFSASVKAVKHLSGRGREKLEKFLLELLNLKENISEYDIALREFLKKVGYTDYMRIKYRKDYEERKENLEELFRFLEEKRKDGISLSEVLEEISLMSQEEEGSDAVSIMTIHASKGLEFSVVFLPRLEEGILPHERSIKDLQELEEERRLFYVAITRAKDLLYMTYTKEKGAKPSRFLSDIPKEHLDLSAYRVKKNTYADDLAPNHTIRVGDIVIHRIFGKGKVLALEDGKAKVDFGDKVKNIHTAFLESIS